MGNVVRLKEKTMVVPMEIVEVHQVEPDRGPDGPCPYCHIPVANEHSIHQSGICDGIRTGKIKKDSIAVLNAALRLRRSK